MREEGLEGWGLEAIRTIFFLTFSFSSLSSSSFLSLSMDPSIQFLLWGSLSRRAGNTQEAKGLLHSASEENWRIQGEGDEDVPEQGVDANQSLVNFTGPAKEMLLNQNFDCGL